MVRFADGLAAVTNALAAIATALLLAAMGAQIVARYVFNSSLFWVDDFATWSLAWLVMLASIRLAWEWRHVHVPLFVAAIPLPLRVPLIVLSKVATIAFLGLMVWYGIEVVAAGFHRTSPGLGLSTRWFKLAIPASMALMVLVVAVSVGRDVAAWRRGEATAFERYGREEAD